MYHCEDRYIPSWDHYSYFIDYVRIYIGTLIQELFHRPLVDEKGLI